MHGHFISKSNSSFHFIGSFYLHFFNIKFFLYCCTCFVNNVSYLNLRNVIIFFLFMICKRQSIFFFNNRIDMSIYFLYQDNSLLITGSADKNVKIWGLDFGDCHKSIFAHDDRYETASLSQIFIKLLFLGIRICFLFA